jgi:hypothetical protein
MNFVGIEDFEKQSVHPLEKSGFNFDDFDDVGPDFNVLNNNNKVTQPSGKDLQSQEFQQTPQHFEVKINENDFAFPSNQNQISN